MRTDGLSSEGSRGLQDLCKLVESIGYNASWGQLQLKNGSFVSHLLDFLEDNPGAIQAIYDWVDDEYPKDEDDG